MSLGLVELKESRRLTKTATGLDLTYIYEVTTPPANEELIFAQSPYQIDDAHPILTTATVAELRVEPQTDDNFPFLIVVYRETRDDIRENQHGEIWEFSIASQQTHITSVKHESKQLHYPTAANVGTAIGVDGEQIQGVDVYRPLGTLRVSKRINASTYSPSFRRNLYRAQNRVNSGNWFDWSAGEVLFLGAEIEPIKSNEWRVTYNFLFADYPGPTAITLADGSQVNVANRPWEYLWLRFGSKTVDGVKQKTALSAHIASVYEFFNFSSFQLQGPE